MSLKWPMLNRARTKGIMLTKDHKPEKLNIQKEKIQPINITESWLSEPDYEEDQKISSGNQLWRFKNTGIKPIFSPLCWHEWLEQNPDDGKFIDCWAQTIMDTEKVVIFGGWYSSHNRKRLKNTPIIPIFFSEIDTKWFEHGEGPPKLTPIHTASYIAKCYEDYTAKGSQKLADECASLVFSVLQSWMFASCKNVTAEEVHPNSRLRHKKSQKKKKDPDRIIYRELIIDKCSKRNGISEAHNRMRGTKLHTRRGHFADYTKGRGLFGKHKCRIWVPNTTVGNKDFGTVLKSYSIGASDENRT